MNIELPEEDVYELDGYINYPVFRKFVKQMLLIMINSESREATRRALHKAVYLKKTLELPFQIRSVRGEDLYPLMDAFERKHEIIRHYINTGIGLYLQYCDSQIAEGILVYLAKDAIPCLPLHDSFMVDYRYEDILNKSMKGAFLEVFEQECQIGIKPSVLVDNIGDTLLELAKREYLGITLKEELETQKRTETDYSRYYKLLREFAEEKNVTIEKPEPQMPPIEVLQECLDELKENQKNIEYLKRTFGHLL